MPIVGIGIASRVSPTLIPSCKWTGTESDDFLREGAIDLKYGTTVQKPETTGRNLLLKFD